MILKGGMIAAAPMGDPNASIPTPQPVHFRPMFGSFGEATCATALTFVSRAALDDGIGARLGLRGDSRQADQNACANVTQRCLEGAENHDR